MTGVLTTFTGMSPGDGDNNRFGIIGFNAKVDYAKEGHVRLRHVFYLMGVFKAGQHARDIISRWKCRHRDTVRVTQVGQLYMTTKFS